MNNEQRMNAQAKRNALLSAFVTRQTIDIVAMGQSGRLTIQGIVNSLQHEDGSGFKFNVCIVSALGSNEVYFDCNDAKHNVMFSYDN